MDEHLALAKNKVDFYAGVFQLLQERAHKYTVMDINELTAHGDATEPETVVRTREFCSRILEMLENCMRDGLLAGLSIVEDGLVLNILEQLGLEENATVTESIYLTRPIGNNYN